MVEALVAGQMERKTFVGMTGAFSTGALSGKSLIVLMSFYRKHPVLNFLGASVQHGVP